MKWRKSKKERKKGKALRKHTSFLPTDESNPSATGRNPMNASSVISTTRLSMVCTAASRIGFLLSAMFPRMAGMTSLADLSNWGPVAEPRRLMV